MPKVKVNEKDGYTVFYDSRTKHFCLNDKEGNELAIADTQGKVEAEIPKLAKQAHKLPIAAIKASYCGVSRGRITSVNVAGGTAFFSYNDKARGTTDKVYLRQGHNLFELTPGNEKIGSKIEETLEQRNRLNEQIEALKEQFEKPINAETFSS